jgi:hypothetical protein
MSQPAYHRPHISQKMLRRAAARLIRIVEEHRETLPLLAAVAAMILLVAQRYIDCYDDHQLSIKQRRAKVKQSRKRVAHLANTIRSWALILKTNAPEEAEGFATTIVPDDVVAKAEQLKKLMATHTQHSEAPLPYAEVAVEQLDEVKRQAKAEFVQAEKLVVQGQKKSKELRGLALELNGHLVALRHILRTELGPSHYDTRALQTTRSGRLEVEAVEGEADNKPVDDKPKESVDGSDRDAVDDAAVDDSVVDAEPVDAANDADCLVDAADDSDSLTDAADDESESDVHAKAASDDE